MNEQSSVHKYSTENLSLSHTLTRAVYITTRQCAIENQANPFLSTTGEDQPNTQLVYKNKLHFHQCFFAALFEFPNSWAYINCVVLTKHEDKRQKLIYLHDCFEYIDDFSI